MASAASRSLASSLLKTTSKQLRSQSTSFASTPKRNYSNIRTAFSQSTQRMDSDSDDGGFSSFFRRRRPVSPLTLVAFYDGSGTDGRGRQLDEVLRWGASNLERHHDYIQTLFPLPEESGFAHAPIINKEVFEAFRSRPELRDRLRDSFEKMLWFYGFGMDKAEDGKITIQVDPNVDHGTSFWNSRFDHNHLRITRIIRCLRVLGLEKEALAFYEAIGVGESKVSPKSRTFWGRAAHRQLNIAPDISERHADPEDRTIGPRWLFEAEEERKKAEAIEAEQNLKEEEQKGAEHKEAEQNGEDQKEEQKELQKMLTESKEKSDVEVGEVVQASEGEKGKTNAETAESGNGVTEPTSQETSNEASNEASRESAEDSKGDRKSEMDTDSADIKDDAMKV